MFDVSTAFRRSIFVLATLSAVMLAIAEGAMFPNVLTVPLALVAYSLTKQRKKWKLPTLAANLLALLALMVAGGEWIRGEMTFDVELVMLARLVAGTHLLIYLMWIVLFQHKTPPHYWWMFALSLLQVAVGSVLTESGLYGLLLFVYLFAAIWTLSLYTLHLARQELQRPVETATALLFTAGPAVVGPREAARSGPGTRSILQPSHVLWENHTRGWLGHRIDLRFVVGACATAVASLGVALLFFLLVPRLWIGELPAVRGGGAGGLAIRLTGFSDEVRLGAMGQILESNERVLFLRAYDADDNEIDVAHYARTLGYDEPLFRGAVLGTYQNGRWVAGRMGNEPDFLVSNRNANQFVRQECRITLTNTKYLFAMHPIRGCQIGGVEQSVGYQPFSAMLLRREERRNHSTVEYTILSPAPVAAMQTPPVIPLPRHVVRAARSRGNTVGNRFGRRFNRMLQQCRYFPNKDGRLSRLQSLARRVAGYDPTSDTQPSPRDMARRLETHLRDSGEYGYSLDASVVNANDDPVEDFLFNRKQGHCEYYAAALALMLRAVDIPSRLVNGFKGGGVNRLTGEFYVEQRHAHAWVEALIDGGWVTLDATPAAARSQSVAGLAPVILSWNDLLNMIKEQWTTSFVAMDVGKQQQQFYRPLKNGLAAAWDSLQAEGAALDGGHLSLRELLTSPENWFSWQGGLATAIILLTLAFLVWGLRRLWKSRGTAPLHSRRNRATEQVRVEFYERFRTLCRALGLARGDSETEREFLVTVDNAMHAELIAAGLERLPGDLVDSFYEVRFGGRRIDVEFEQHIDSQLTALEQLASPPRAAHTPRKRGG